MKVECIFHKDIQEKELNDIIKIKSAAWKYSYEEHLRWMSENISSNDIHALLKNKENISLAYLNLIEIKIVINNTEQWSYGIGNVCALKRGFGDGANLIKEMNSYLIDNDKIGVLFCKDELVPFYESLDWTPLPSNIKENYIVWNNINIFIFNFPNEIIQFQYDGTLF